MSDLARKRSPALARRRSREEVLEICREAWTQAALQNTPQFHFSIPATWSSGNQCAESLLLISKAELLPLQFQCPEHSGRQRLPHFNDVHEWDWLTLATKLGMEPYQLLLEADGDAPPS